MRFTDRVAVVTGGGRGIGAACVRRFAAEGAKVLVADVNAAAGARVANELRDEFGIDAIDLATDVSDKQQVLAMITAATSRWGTIDILVNNAWGGGSLSRLAIEPCHALGDACVLLRGSHFVSICPECGYKPARE